MKKRTVKDTEGRTVTILMPETKAEERFLAAQAEEDGGISIDNRHSFGDAEDPPTPDELD